MKYLGETFDIHTGGVDLVFPHHENEIAQSEAFSGKKFVNYWMHNEWVLADGKKMSKSLKNFHTLNDLRERGYSPMDLRYFYISKNYRQQINFTFENLTNSKNSLERLKNIIFSLDQSKKMNKKNVETAKSEFMKIMDDDLNFTKALSYLWEILRDDKLSDSEKYELAGEFDKVLGLKLLEKEKIEVPEKIRELIEEREKARKEKNWKKADELREKIKDNGFEILDGKDGWEVKKRNN